MALERTAKVLNRHFIVKPPTQESRLTISISSNGYLGSCVVMSSLPLQVIKQRQEKLPSQRAYQRDSWADR